MLTYKSFLKKRYKRPFHGAREAVTRGKIIPEFYPKALMDICSMR